jgi:hypothetical protein
MELESAIRACSKLILTSGRNFRQTQRRLNGSQFTSYPRDLPQNKAPLV